MNTRYHLECLACGQTFPAIELYRCSACGGELDLRYDLPRIRAEGEVRAAWRAAGPSWRRFLSLLSLVSPNAVVTLGEGDTPLVRSGRLAARLGLRDLYFKLEGCNPTGSFKDRQVAVAMSKLREWGRSRIGTASSGNVGVAVSAYAARAGAEANVWVSGDTAESKRRQIEVYGARLFLLPTLAGDGVGPYYAAFTGMNAFCVRHGMVPMISARPVNPYMVEGAKLIAYEIAAELGRAPDILIAPVGGGGLLGGLWKGSRELAEIGVVSGTPVIHGVQKGAYFAPIDRQHDPEWQSDRFYRPLDGDWAWSSIQASGGTLRRVEDPEIRAAQAVLAQEEGIFVEPHGAYVIAGLLAAAEAGTLDRDALTVCVLTGAGLKDMKAAAEMIERHGSTKGMAVESLAASDIYFTERNAMPKPLSPSAAARGSLGA